MIFQHNEGVQKILAGQKTQTRRIVKPNHHPLNYWRTEIGDDLRIGMAGDGTNIGVVQSSGRDMWQVYNTYAVQPGRGKPAVARIRITDIRCEDVREISDPDIRAEGFLDENIAEAHLNFLAVWAGMHDKPLGFYRDEKRWQWDGTWGYKGEGKDQLADTVTAFEAFRERPAENYQAWALTFELVQP